MPVAYRKISALCAYSLLILVLASCGPAENKSSPAPVAVVQSSDSAMLAALNTKIKTDPDNAALLAQRSELYQKSGQFKKALNDIEKAIGIDSTQAEWQFSYANLLFLNGKIKVVHAALQKCLTLNPEHVEARLKLSEYYLYLKSYKAAIAEANKVLEKDKLNARAFFQRGIILKEAGDTSRAIESFQRAVELQPAHYEAFMQLGIIFGDRLNTLGLEYYNQAIKLKPNSTEAWYGKGLLLQELGKLKESEQAYQTLLQTDSTFFNAWYNLGFIAAQLKKDYRQGTVYFTRTIQFNPQYADAYYMRGWCFENLGEYAKAGRDYSLALEKDNSHLLAGDGLKRIQKQ